MSSTTNGNSSDSRTCGSEAIFCFDTATVRFALYPTGSDGPRIVAQIAEPALRDLFGACGGGDSLVEAYKQYSAVIDALALKRYQMAPATTLMLETVDFEVSRCGTEAATC